MTRAVTDEERTRFRHAIMPYLADCYALARWLTGDRADAEDVVQDACLRALRGIGGFSGYNPRAWMLTIVRNAAYSWLRKNRSTALIMVGDLEAVEHAQANHALDPSADTPEATLITKTETARLERAIAELPVPFREAVVLRDIQGLGYRDIADVTGVPVGTVMSRLARARSRLVATMGAP